MCEFTAILETGQERKELARNIVKAKTKDGRIALMDSLGRITKIEGAVIVVVDTLMQELILRNGSISDQKVVNEASTNSELEGLRRFHGHLGPYVVLGMRMGQVARLKYPNRIFAKVYCGKDRPRSCIADGIQYSSCCTVGKNNIEILDGGEARAIFSDGRTSIEISALPQVSEEIDANMGKVNEEDVSSRIFQDKAEDLFSIVSSELGK
jgi:formylmethanofuran dehydrogenase subunit E